MKEYRVGSRWLACDCALGVRGEEAVAHYS